MVRKFYEMQCVLRVLWYEALMLSVLGTYLKCTVGDVGWQEN